MTMKNITRGGQFLVKETKAEDIFTPEKRLCFHRGNDA